MTHTIKDLADFLGCTLEGDGSAILSGVASTASAHAEDLIYVESPRHLDGAAASAARCVVIAAGLSLPRKVLLRAANPKLAFARAAEWLLPPTPIAQGIHPTALIAPSARLAPGAAVGPYAVIEDDVQIGAGTEIGAFCFLGRGAQLGEKCRLYPRVHIAHNVRIGENTVVAAQTGISGSSIIGRNVAIGGQVGIADHCEIENGVVVGAQAGIPSGKVVRSGQIVWGTPARPLDKFKKQFAWFSRLPELAERVKRLESRLGTKHE